MGRSHGTPLSPQKWSWKWTRVPPSRSCHGSGYGSGPGYLPRSGHGSGHGSGPGYPPPPKVVMEMDQGTPPEVVIMEVDQGTPPGQTTHLPSAIHYTSTGKRAVFL